MIYVVGDMHGYFENFRNTVDREFENCNTILSVGDFGYWPHTEYFRKNIAHLAVMKAPIYFCDGNHEDHHSLQKKVKKCQTTKIIPNVYYQPRGSVLDIGGYKILFFGGASSIDKHLRTPGFDWFPEENITEKDLQNLPPENTKIDIVISHTCPTEFNIKDDLYNGHDFNRIALSHILHTFKPNLWFFGHWHKAKVGAYDNTVYIALNQFKRNGYFYQLQEKWNSNS